MKELYFTNFILITNLKRIVVWVREQNYDSAMSKYRTYQPYLQKAITSLIEYTEYWNMPYVIAEETTILMLLQQIIDAQEKKDYLLLADLLELQLLPILQNMQNNMREKEQSAFFFYCYDGNIEVLKSCGKWGNTLIKQMDKVSNEELAEYEIEPTTDGISTLKAKNQKQEFYFHGNYNPIIEAEQFINVYFQVDKQVYLVFGLGLGYHVQSLCERTKGEAQIYVYERDLAIIKLAFIYNNMQLLLADGVRIIYDPNLQELSKALQKGEGILVPHYPSIRNIRNESIRNRFEQLFLQDSSQRFQQEQLEINFRANIKRCRHFAEELIDKIQGKDVYIVAAGPSLDQNIHFLKEKPQNSFILAVGTVFRKLQQLAIPMDAVIVSDANQRVLYQIDNTNTEDIPMLLLSTACLQFAKHYKGDCYLICQEEFPLAKEYAETNHAKCYLTGGSVSTTALDAAIRLGASRIIFLGLDLAYTNSLAHASDTSLREMSDLSDCILVKGNVEAEVPASHAFILYREWIEDRIAKENQIEFINATEGGAFIKGMKHIPLQEVLYAH